MADQLSQSTLRNPHIFLHSTQVQQHHAAQKHGTTSSFDGVIINPTKASSHTLTYLSTTPYDHEHKHAYKDKQRSSPPLPHTTSTYTRIDTPRTPSPHSQQRRSSTSNTAASTSTSPHRINHALTKRIPSLTHECIVYIAHNMLHITTADLNLLPDELLFAVLRVILQESRLDYHYVRKLKTIDSAALREWLLESIDESAMIIPQYQSCRPSRGHR